MTERVKWTMIYYKNFYKCHNVPPVQHQKKKKKFSLSLKLKTTRCLTPVILATQKQKSGGLWFKASSSKQFTRPYLKKSHHKKRLVEWLKV
jgi:hypothetical protein